MGLHHICKNIDIKWQEISAKLSSLKASPNYHTKGHSAYIKLEHQFQLISIVNILLKSNTKLFTELHWIV